MHAKYYTNAAYTLQGSRQATAWHGVRGLTWCRVAEGAAGVGGPVRLVLLDGARQACGPPTTPGMIAAAAAAFDFDRIMLCQLKSMSARVHSTLQQSHNA